ncbi:uncharacterized protein [Diadema setosum]|uniref:uncharacterized protein n=1 Tax=Diadema setosum TaxID=31175 RepID=UPI003B3AA6E8
MSTESDGYGESETGSVMSGRQRVQLSQRGRSRSSSRSDVPNRLDSLTSSLRDTNKNLLEVGDLLNQYRDANSRQTDAIERLRENLSTANQQRDHNHTERLSRYESDTMSASELRSGREARHRRTASEIYTRRLRPSVRFSRDVDEIHDIHRDLRDLSRDQTKLAAELQQERRQRTQLDTDNRRILLDLSDSMKRSQREESRPSDHVERRLRDIQEELRSQRESSSRKYETRDRDQIRAEIRETVLNASREEDRQLRSRFLEVETQRQKLASDLERTRAKLDRSEGSTAALQQQVDSLRRDLSRSNEDRHQLKTELTSLKDSFIEDEVPPSRHERQRRAKQAEAENQRETGKLEQEIQSLRAQLSQASSLREFEGQRRELEQSHRQREQLSQHIDTLNKELDGKDKSQAQLLSQLRDATDDLAESERQRKLALSQLESLQARLQQKTSESKAFHEQAKESERLLLENQTRKEEKQRKVYNMAKQLKTKCKSLEQDLEASKHTSSQQGIRIEELLRENEALHSQKTNTAHKMDTLQRELSDILERFAQQDEQLRLRDIEVNELKSTCLRLEQELKDTRNLTDRLNGDMASEQARHRVLCEDKIKLEQELDSCRRSLQQAEERSQRAQRELRDTSKQNADLSARLSELAMERKEASRQLAVAEEEKQNVKQDLARLDAKFKEVQDFNAALTEKLHTEIENAKVNEKKTVQDVVLKQKRERAELEAEIQALKIELAESRSSAKSLRRQIDRTKSEAEKVREELRFLDDENIKLKRNYDRMRAGFEEQTQLVEVGDNRASAMEKHLQRAELTIQDLRLDHEDALRALVREVDILVGLVSESSLDSETLQPFSRPHESHETMLHDLKSKLYWLQEEVRRQADKRLRLAENLNRSRSEVDDIKKQQLANRVAYETKLDVTEDLLRGLQREKEDLHLQNLERAHTVKSLEKQVENMEDHIRAGTRIVESSFEALREPDRFPPPSPPSPKASFDRLKELERERQRIEEKYNRYQSTVAHLHQQLNDSKTLYSSPPRRDRSVTSARGDNHL